MYTCVLGTQSCLTPWTIDSPGKNTGVVTGRGTLSRALSNTQK